MATRGARVDIFIWICSVRGWGYIAEEIFEKKNLLKKLGNKKVILDAEELTRQGFPRRVGRVWWIFLYEVDR